MKNYMRYIFAVIMIYVLLAPVAGRAQETAPSTADAYFSSPVSSTDRFQIVMAPVAERHIFRLDRNCGIVEQLIVNDRKMWAWQTMRVPNLFPCMNDGRNHYQFFAAAHDNHVFLIHTDTKVTWRLDMSRMAWVHM